MSSTEDINSREKREDGGVDGESVKEKERKTETDQRLHTG